MPKLGRQAGREVSGSDRGEHFRSEVVPAGPEGSGPLPLCGGGEERAKCGPIRSGISCFGCSLCSFRCLVSSWGPGTSSGPTGGSGALLVMLPALVPSAVPAHHRCGRTLPVTAPSQFPGATNSAHPYFRCPAGGPGYMGDDRTPSPKARRQGCPAQAASVAGQL